MTNSKPTKSDNEWTELGSDRPIESQDQDLLGRVPFARQLSNAIKNWTENESLVIALCGEWGIGKSSLKNLVLEQLRLTEATPDIVQFNPWQWTGHDSLTAGFFREVLAVLSGRRDRDTQEVVRRLRRYAAYLGVINVVLRGPKGLLSIILGLFGLLSIVPPLFINHDPARIFSIVLGSAALSLAALMAWGEQILAKLAAWRDLTGPGARPLEELKQDVAIALRRYRKTLVVVIDDVDRLTAAEVQAVFQLVKANADFPRFVYLVMFQRSAVEKALQELTKETGREFLEKIVQISFEVPAARQDEVDKFLSTGLEQAFGTKVSTAVNPTYWGAIYYRGLRHYFRHLRDVKRFLACLQFHVNLLRTNGTLEVNVVDLFAIETLRLFEPEFYARIRESKVLLTSTRSPDRSDRSRIAEEIKAILSPIPEHHKKSASELIRNLFPMAAFAFGDSFFSSDHYAEWSRDLRVCAPDIFDRYFQLELSKGDISQFEVERLLNLAANHAAFLKELKGFDSEGRLVAVLDRLDANKDKIASADTVSMLTALFDIGECLPEPAPGSFFGSDWTIIRIAYAMLKREPEPERIHKLKEILKGTNGLRIPVMFISVNTDPRGRQNNPADIIIPDSAVRAFQQLGVEMIKSSAAEGRLLDRYDLESLLFRWRDWAGESEPRQWVQNVTATSPPGTLAYLRGVLRKATHTNGDGVGRVNYFMKYSEIEKFANLEELEMQVASLADAKLSEGDRRVLAEFRKAVARKRAGKKEGDFGWDNE